MTTEALPFFSRLSSENQGAFYELTHIGYLTHSFVWGGHEFVLRTLTIDEELAIGQLVKHYEGAFTQQKALVTAIVAASLMSVDGKPPFVDEIVNDPILNLREKYRKISEKWHWPVIEKLNDEYIVLQEKLLEQIKEIENLSLEGRAKIMGNSTELFDPSKEHPFLAGEDPTDFS